ncbi:MAG: hypothetical protein ACYTHN_18195, partial [Planctomycetota bacterium]
MGVRTCTAGILALLLGLQGVGVAQEAAPEKPLDRQEVQRLLGKVTLSTEEAVALLGLPEALQHKVLRALAGEYGEGVFTTAEWILLKGLPERLKSR